MATLKRIHCPGCRKVFKTESGLAWHLFHIHQSANARQLPAPQPPKTIGDITKDALKEHMHLVSIAEATGLEIGQLRQIVAEYVARQSLL